MLKARKNSIVILIIIGLTSILFAFQLKDIQYDFDLTSFYPIDDEQTHFFNEYVDQFGTDNDFVLIGLHNNEGVFQKDFLVRVDSLAHQLDSLLLITQVIAPTNIKEYQRIIIQPKPIKRPYLHFQIPNRYQEDSIRIYEAPHLVHFLFSEDAQSVMLFLQTEHFLKEQDCSLLTSQLQDVVQQYTFDRIHMAGKCIVQTTFIGIIQSEAEIFTAAIVLFLIFCLFITYRTFWGIWIPMSVVGLAVVWTMAIMVLNGKAIDFVANILPTIILIIGISNAIHLLTSYLSKIRNGEVKLPALKASIREVGIATLMTTFTTALGFLTLTTSSFVSIVDAGIYAAIGLVLALGFTYLVIPSVLVLHPPLIVPEKRSDSFWDQKLETSFQWVVQHQNTVLWISGLVILLGIVGVSQIKLNTYLLQDLRSDHPLQQDFTFLGEEFGGARSFELSITLNDTSQNIFDLTVLREIDQVDSFLIHNYGVKNLISPAILIKHAHLIYRGQEQDFYRLPEKVNLLATLERSLYKNDGDFELEKLITEDKTTARISGRLPDWGSHMAEQKNQTLLNFIAEKLPDAQLDYRITGSPHLIDTNSNYLAKNVLQGLLFAVIIIGLLFSYILRSFRMIGLSMIPNVLPLLFVGGVMGFGGIDLMFSTSIIFIIAFGIAVDDSIHFLSRFWKEVKHRTVEEAVYHTYMTTGKAIVLTTFVLVGGFLIICVSDFLATVYIGLLIAVTLLVALIADMTLLPVLLLKFYKKRS